MKLRKKMNPDEIDQLKQCALMVQILSVLKWTTALKKLIDSPLINRCKIEIIENTLFIEGVAIKKKNACFSVSLNNELMNSRYLVSWKEKYEPVSFWKKQIKDGYISFEDNVLELFNEFNPIHESLWLHVSEWIINSADYRKIEFSSETLKWQEKAFGQEFGDELRFLIFNEKNGLTHLSHELKNMLRKTQE
jgi:hypothetical protein